MEWISVKDRLPENRQDVFVCDYEGQIFNCYYRDVLGDFVSDYHEYKFKAEPTIEDMENDYLFPLTHWMPLPEPPTQ